MGNSQFHIDARLVLRYFFYCYIWKLKFNFKYKIGIPSHGSNLDGPYEYTDHSPTKSVEKPLQRQFVTAAARKQYDNVDNIQSGKDMCAIERAQKCNFETQLHISNALKTMVAANENFRNNVNVGQFVNMMNTAIEESILTIENAKKSSLETESFLSNLKKNLVPAQKISQKIGYV